MDITIKNLYMAQQSYKTTHKMRGSHISVAEDSSVLGCDTVCLVSSSEVGWYYHLQSQAFSEQ